MIFEALSIDPGDVVGALIIATSTFWVAYSRNRKSEQLKIARELLDRMEMRHTILKELELPPPPSTMEEQERKWREEFSKALESKLKPESAEKGSDDEPPVPEYIFWNYPKIPIGKGEERKVFNAIRELLMEIDYFRHLLERQEIRNSIVLSYCIPRLQIMFMILSSIRSKLEKYESSVLKSSKFHMKEVEANMEKWLNDPKYRMDRSSVYEMFTEYYLDQQKDSKMNETHS